MDKTFSYFKKRFISYTILYIENDFRDQSALTGLILLIYLKQIIRYINIIHTEYRYKAVSITILL